MTQATDCTVPPGPHAGPHSVKATVARVYRHKGSRNWQIAFQVDGTTYRRSSRTTNSRQAIAQAKHWRAAVLAARTERPPVASPDMTFDEAAQIYWEQHGQFTRSAAALAGNLARLVRMVGPDRLCSTISRNDERQIRAVLRQGVRPEGIGQRGRPLEVAGAYRPKTINHYTDLIGTVLNWVGIIPPIGGHRGITGKRPTARSCGRAAAGSPLKGSGGSSG